MERVTDFWPETRLDPEGTSDPTRPGPDPVLTRTLYCLYAIQYCIHYCTIYVWYNSLMYTITVHGSGIQGTESQSRSLGARRLETPKSKALWGFVGGCGVCVWGFVKKHTLVILYGTVSHKTRIVVYSLVGLLKQKFAFGDLMCGVFCIIGFFFYS